MGCISGLLVLNAKTFFLHSQACGLNSSRSISPDAFKLALGRRYNRTKKANGQRGPEKLGQIDPAKSTAAKLAAEHSVSEATVKRAGKFADEVAAKPDAQALFKRDLRLAGSAGLGAISQIARASRFGIAPT